MWPDQPEYRPTKWLPGASFRVAITSEYLGVGYIIGPKTAGTIFAGGVFSWLVLMPAIRFFGESLTGPLYPSTIPISQMDAGRIVVELRSPDRRGCRGRCGTHHTGSNAADDCERAHPGLKDIRAQRAAGSGAVQPA